MSVCGIPLGNIGDQNGSGIVSRDGQLSRMGGMDVIRRVTSFLSYVSTLNDIDFDDLTGSERVGFLRLRSLACSSLSSPSRLSNDIFPVLCSLLCETFSNNVHTTKSLPLSLTCRVVSEFVSVSVSMSMNPS